jgi:hypothetical protein
MYYCGATGKDLVGQQPNIEFEISDLRPRRKPDPATAWVPGRPGELGGPEDMKRGAGFGTSGPDAGYALSLVAKRYFDLADGEHRANANVAVAAVSAARSSLFGRGPTKKDVDMALVLLGYDAEGVPAETITELATARITWFAAAGHHPAKLNEFVSGLDVDSLKLTADEARGRMAQGEQLVTR